MPTAEYVDFLTIADFGDAAPVEIETLRWFITPPMDRTGVLDAGPGDRSHSEFKASSRHPCYIILTMTNCPDCLETA